MCTLPSLPLFHDECGSNTNSWPIRGLVRRRVGQSQWIPSGVTHNHVGALPRRTASQGTCTREWHTQRSRQAVRTSQPTEQQPYQRTEKGEGAHRLLALCASCQFCASPQTAVVADHRHWGYFGGASDCRVLFGLLLCRSATFAHHQSVCKAGSCGESSVVHCSLMEE